MRKSLTKLANAIDRLNEQVGRAVAWLTTALVLLVCYEVGLGIFNKSANWVTELEWHLFALIFLLGAGYAFKHDRHVRVDLFYTKFSARDKALTDFIGNLIFLIPWCIVLIYVAFSYALASFKINEGSPDPGGLPARYLIKFSIVIGIFLLLLQGIAELIKAYNTLINSRKADSLEPNETPESL